MEDVRLGRMTGTTFTSSRFSLARSITMISDGLAGFSLPGDKALVPSLYFAVVKRGLCCFDETLPDDLVGVIGEICESFEGSREVEFAVNEELDVDILVSEFAGSKVGTAFRELEGDVLTREGDGGTISLKLCPGDTVRDIGASVVEYGVSKVMASGCEWEKVEIVARDFLADKGGGT